MILQQTVAPTTEPVSVDILKKHLRLNYDDEDVLLSGYISAARQLFEMMTGRQLLPATYKLYLDHWSNPLYLPRPPLRSLTSVQYYNASDVLTAYTDYHLDSVSEPAKLHLNLTVPALEFQGSRPRIVVEYVAGSTSIDQLIKQAILLLAASYYEQRGTLGARLEQLPYGFRAIVDKYTAAMVGDWNKNSVYGTLNWWGLYV